MSTSPHQQPTDAHAGHKVVAARTPPTRRGAPDAFTAARASCSAKEWTLERVAGGRTDVLARVDAPELTAGRAQRLRLAVRGGGATLPAHARRYGLGLAAQTEAGAG